MINKRDLSLLENVSCQIKKDVKSMITIQRYNVKEKNIWDEFNHQSKNSLFMFDRNYMDYHSDRFKDHSLMFFEDSQLIALLPLNEKDHTLVSHGGLTYGGFITDSNMKQHIMNDCFTALLDYAREKGFQTIRYKAIPHIYHEQAAEEDRYALFINGAKQVSVDASTYLNLKNPLKMPKGRKAQISRARREGVLIKELETLQEYQNFIKLENEVLSARHHATAVHTGDELKLLHDYFPDHIHLFGALKDEELIAGTAIYEYNHVVHTQYMAANDEARRIGALDLTISSVIEKYRDCKNWLDFGISTEHDKIYLNEGLISQKEGFGGRTGVYEMWEIAVK